MDWFCFHVEAVNNRKVVELPDRLFRFWVGLLCVCRSHGGQLPPAADIAFELRMPLRKVEAMLPELMPPNRTFFERFGDNIIAHDWEDWQPKSDAGAAERMRNFRERKRRALRDSLRNVTPIEGEVKEDSSPKGELYTKPLEEKQDVEMHLQPARKSEQQIAIEQYDAKHGTDSLRWWEMIQKLWTASGKPLCEEDWRKALHLFVKYPGEEEAIFMWCVQQFKENWTSVKHTPFPWGRTALESEGWHRVSAPRCIPSAEDVRKATLARRISELQANGGKL